MTTLESGETQGVYNVPAQSLPRLEKNTAIRVEKAPWPGVPRIWLLNVTKPPMDDVKVRRAINYAIDKDAFLATVYKGTALKASSPLTAVMLDDPSLKAAYPFDLGKAKALLGEAGWQPGSRRYPHQGRPAARDRPQRHRVRRRDRSDGPAHPGRCSTTSAST